MDDDGSELCLPDAPCEPTKDEDYYMEAFFVTFEVEGRLFRVPSYQFFKESPEFSEINKLSTHVRAANDSQAGSPIRLENVSQSDFRSLLKVLYPLSLSVELSLLKKEWISVITLASEWKFLRVREMARGELEHLGSLTSLEKICLGRDLSIPSWVTSGFIGLVRATTITDDQAIIIDSAIMTTAYKLFRIRELRIAGSLGSVKSKVEEIFKEELDRLCSEETRFYNEEMTKPREEKKEIKDNNEEQTAHATGIFSGGLPLALEKKPMETRVIAPAPKKKIGLRGKACG